MLSPSSVKQIPVRSSLQLQLLSRVSQIRLPVDSKSTDMAAARQGQDMRVGMWRMKETVKHGVQSLTFRAAAAGRFLAILHTQRVEPQDESE